MIFKEERAGEGILFSALYSNNEEMIFNIKIQQQLTSEDLNYLQSKFEQLFNPLGKSATLLLQSIIFQYYQETHRTYHNLSHIYNLLKLSEQLDISNRLGFEIAIWYHDIIYQPHFKDNEAQSAVLFLKDFDEHFLSTNFTDEENKRWINQTILSTFGHQPRINNLDTKLFLDADLAILAADTKTYEIYTKAIRTEYNIYPDHLYYQGRKQVMTHFLERPKIYFTDTFEPFEQQARQNIISEIS